MVNIVIFSPLDQIQKATPLTKLTFPFLGAKLLYNWLCLSVYLSVVLSVVCSSVFTPLAVLYMAIVYIVYNDSLLFLETNPPPLPILDRLLLSVFSLNSSVNCLNTTDKIFAPMDDGRPCYYLTIFRTCMGGGRVETSLHNLAPSLFDNWRYPFIYITKPLKRTLYRLSQQRKSIIPDFLNTF